MQKFDAPSLQDPPKNTNNKSSNNNNSTFQIQNDIFTEISAFLLINSDSSLRSMELTLDEDFAAILSGFRNVVLSLFGF